MPLTLDCVTFPIVHWPPGPMVLPKLRTKPLCGLPSLTCPAEHVGQNVCGTDGRTDEELDGRWG